MKSKTIPSRPNAILDDIPELLRLREIYDPEQTGCAESGASASNLDILKQSVARFSKLTTDLTKQGKI